MVFEESRRNRASDRSDACSRMAQTRQRALAPEDVEHFVDAGADGTTGDGHSYRLRELSELQIARRERAVERLLDAGVVPRRQGGEPGDQVVERGRDRRR